MAEEPSCSEAATAREPQTLYSNCTINAAMMVMSQGNQATAGVDVSHTIVGGSHVTKHRADLKTPKAIKRKKNSSPELQTPLKMTAKEASQRDYIVLENGLFGFYKTRFICERSKVYHGVQISGISGTGTQPRAIKFVEKNKKNLREAQILVKLGSHVNVVTIINAGTYISDPIDYIYIAMEHSWTQTVRNLLEVCIKQGKPFHEFIAWNLVEQLMRAVEFFHSHHIIHRDLKPDNVLASDDWRLFKVTDFGLSKKIKDGISTIQTNDNTGTGGYCSSETYNFNAKITAKADIFSAGVTIAEIMANGKHPFGEEPDLWKYNIKKNKNLDLSHLCVVKKNQVISLIKPMLEMVPEKRPTAKDVLNNVSHHFQTFQLNNQQTGPDESLATTSKAITELSIPEKVLTGTTADESLASTSKAMTELSITEKVNAIIMFNTSDNHLLSYKPSTKEWSPMQEFSLGSEFPEFTTVLSGKHIYILIHQEVRQLEYSDPTAEWKEMSGILKYHGLIYVCGKYDEASPSVERYDATRDRWDHICSMNHARWCPCVVATEDHIYCMGGGGSNGLDLSVERFHERLNKWENVKPSPTPITDARAAVTKNRIYVAHGDGRVLCYDIQSNSWSEINLTNQWPFDVFFFRHVEIFAIDEKLYIIGVIGSTYEKQRNAIYLLEPETEQMTLVEDFEDKEINFYACLAVKI